MIIKSAFKPAWWLPGPHLQTLWPVVFRSRPRLSIKKQRLELSDGDFLDLAWIGNNPGPSVLILHGLEGAITSHYAGTLLQALDQQGFNPVFMHFRGCSGEPNRLSRSYHSGETGDLDYVVEYLETHSQKPLSAAVGFSLGGNVLLKWLAEKSSLCHLKTAVAVSVPFLLDDCASRLDQGVSRLYQAYLLRSLRRSYKQRMQIRASHLAINVDRLKNFRTFDDAVTAPVHGFNGVDDYYRKSSSRQYLHQIKTPTLILHASDDPFMWPDTVPDESELSTSVRLELSRRGGHVGFVAGIVPWKATYWIQQRILQHLGEMLH